MAEEAAGEVGNMKKEYIKGYLIDEAEVGCERYPVCYTCPFKTCKEELSDIRKQQIRDAGKRYREKHKDQIREKQKRWKEKQRLAKLLDQKRSEAESGGSTSTM